MKLSLRKVHLTGAVVRTHSHQAIAGANAEKIKEQEKKSNNKRQTSKKIFAFSRCE